MVFALICKICIIIWIIAGNFLVIISVSRDVALRKQQQNILILSLATADLLVGLIVMPLTVTYESMGEWKLGLIICELWLALDVLFVTSSILNLCMISLDRYWSLTYPLAYLRRRTQPFMFILSGFAWCVSLVISLPPLVGWRPQRVPGKCALSTEVGYVLYSALGSFYLPVIVLLFVYFRIFLISKKMSKHSLQKEIARNTRLKLLTSVTEQEDSKPQVSSLSFSIGECNTTINLTPSKTSEHKSDEKEVETPNQTAQLLQPSTPGSTDRKSKRKARVSAAVRARQKMLKRRERQANITVSLILVAFILCWLPFFVIYVLGAFGIEAQKIIFDIFFWLGYCNSGFNPIIYTIFNREFRRAFKRQLHCDRIRYTNKRSRPRRL